ncbi:MAG: hypothetical protein A2W11_07495 [Ignavibacteria bacterium RBG_16_35_7]|nr:MAG: hypothetical protein A2W11_07495 [Ignavibacteria bacterium RBG_16_35_7]
MMEILKAICNDCKYTAEVAYGSILDNFVKVARNFPAINKKTSEIETIDYLKKNSLSTDYIFYNEHMANKNYTLNGGYQDFDLWLNVNDNLCPKCGNFSLTFEPLIHMSYY